MATLEAFDANALRKSRRNSMLMMASQLNLNSLNENGDQKDTVSLGANGIAYNQNLRSKADVNGRESLIRVTSALYGKLIFFLGLAFPVAQFFSESKRAMFIYNSFYLYLYWGSISFIVFSYTILLRKGKSPLHIVILSRLRDIKLFLKPYQPKMPDLKFPDQLRHLLQVSTPVKNKEEISQSCNVSNYSKDVESHIFSPPKSSKFEISEESHGSMYLKMGTVFFGIGSMVYSGLEFGEYFELKTDCSDILLAISPFSMMLFTFLQMYYIYLNSRVSIVRHTYISCFGLMHMLATNLCIWLNVLVAETKHTLHHVLHEQEHHDTTSNHAGTGSHGNIVPSVHEVISSHSTIVDGHPPQESNLHNLTSHLINETAMYFKSSSTDYPIHSTIDHLTDHVTYPDISHDVVKRMATYSNDCRVTNLLGDLVARSSPLLFPCTIEYSLLCAGVIYVMWANVRMPSTRRKESDADSEISHMVARKFRHLYSVDCARSSRGLFMGIFILVLSIISLVLFIVLVNNKDFQNIAVLQANITEIIIYGITILTSIVAMYQMRKLSHYENDEVELDNILLLIAQAGVYIFCSFTIVSDYFNLKEDSALPMLTALFALIQATIQTLLILGASKRTCTSIDQVDSKPGRELITFILVCNLAMWAMSTFQTSRSEVHPHQLEFFGPWAWTIISHISMPLAIFYRFHATVCLGEIWKKSYKIPHCD